MGEFDDVLAMEPGDEWKDFDAGEQLAGRPELRPLVETLFLPGLRIELRGDVPAALLEVAVDLRIAGPEQVSGLTTVTFTLDEDSGTWSIDGHERGPAGTASSTGELIELMVDLLAGLTGAGGPSWLGLDAAQVVLAERGGSVLVVTPDVGLRHAVTTELLDLGAGFMSADVALLLAGSRTSFAWPLPVRAEERLPDGSSRRRVPGSARSPVVHHITPGTVVLIDQGTHPGSAPQQLTTAEGCARLLLDAGAMRGAGADALDVVASLGTEVTFWTIPVAAPQTLARTIVSLPFASRRELAVVHRSTERTSSVRLARFESGGVVCDASTGVAAVVSDAEVDALESLLCLGRPAGEGDGLHRIESMGVHLPQAGARRRSSPQKPPSVDCFGLPNCPAGAVARSAWSEAGNPTLGAAGATPSAAFAEAVAHGVVDVADDERATLLDHSAALRARDERIQQVLAAVMGALAAEGDVPLVLGAPVHAHDGLLPVGFTDGDGVDLLVDPERVTAVVAQLRAHGFVQQGGGGLPRPGDPEPGCSLCTPDGADVVRLFDRLAVGPFGELVDHDDFRRRSVPVRIGSVWCMALHPEDRFVAACVRLDLGGREQTLQDLRDVVTTAPRSERLMAEALEASARWGATTVVLAALRTVGAAMPGLSPWLVDRANRSPSPPRPRRRVFARR